MSEPVRFDHAAIAEAAIDLCAVVRRTCPLKDGPSCCTGSRDTFDSDVAAYGQLSRSSMRLARLLNPGAADPLIGILAWESPHHIHRGEPDERLQHALLKVWEGFASRPKLHFSSHSWNPSDRTMSPRSLPTIDPAWLNELEAAGQRLRDMIPAGLAAGVFQDRSDGESSDAVKAPWRDYLEKARGQFLELARPDVRFVAVARGQRDDSPQPLGSGKIEWATQDLVSLGGWTLGPDPASDKRQARFGLHATHPVERHAADKPPNATAAFRHAVTLAVSGILAGGQGPLDTKGMDGRTADLATRAWIRALFDLCWAGCSPNLRAPRIYWAQMLHDGLVLDTTCECPAWIAEQWAIGETPPLNVLEAAMGGPPPWYAHWYAILPDVALASVAACDFLLSYSPSSSAFEESCDEDPIDPQTAGLVLSALELGRKISPRFTAVTIPPASAGHVIEYTYPAGSDQAKFDALDRLYALLDQELGVERPVALRGLIGRVAVARNTSRAKAANLPLAEFVQAASTILLRDDSPRYEPAANQVPTHRDTAVESLVANPLVAELLLLLWRIEERAAGIPIDELPAHMRDKALLAACETHGLVEFARRNHCIVGDRPVLEPGWEVANLNRPGFATAADLVTEALTKPVDAEIRHRVRIAYLGDKYASRAALTLPSGPEKTATPQNSEPNANHLEPPRDADSPKGYLGGMALADALGIHESQRNAFFQQLGRRRIEVGDDNWHEVREPRPNQPRFLYRADSPAVRALAAPYKSPKAA